MRWRDADDDLDDAEFPDEADEGDDDDDDTIPCPYCLRPVYEDAERCPACGHYLSREDRERPSRHPWWLVIGVLVCLLVTLRWVIP
jgi:predicted nucleic acid-binding Zn ribbon protein